MRELLSVDREANAIRLQRTTFSGAFLLVEGGSDKVFYERFTDKAQCRIVTVSGKPSSKARAIAILTILEETHFQGILAIVDADFDRLALTLHQSRNLLHTDTHDLETMLLNSFALEKVIAEFGSEEKIANLRQEVRTLFLEAGIVVGYLRWVSQLKAFNLAFSNLKFSSFLDEQTLQINELKLIQEVKNKTQALSLNDEELQQCLLKQKDATHDPWQVCCGHDLIAILSFGFRKVIGSNKPTEVEPLSLERNLRLAYEASYFLKSQLYQDICAWESTNSPFRVLRADL
jgi:hypothetical protein